ncbi:MAG TPA: STAS domain-containing protein [Abditibacterium sp.]|jgi:anti-sigma B factor antagonist
MDLRMRVRREGEIVVVEVGGEIDLHSAPQLRAELMKATEPIKATEITQNADSGSIENAKSGLTDTVLRGPRVVVDLADVFFIDSTGIGVLVGALKRARERNGALHFCNSQSRVRRVFEITGLMRALPLFDSREAALAGFSVEEEKS